MICTKTSADGTPCGAPCQRGMDFCAPHNPEMKDIRRRAREARASTVDAIERRIADCKAELSTLRRQRAALKRKSR